MRLIFSVLLLSLMIVAACDPFKVNTPHPSDGDLIRNFQRNEADFNRLVRMSNEDSNVIRIAHDFTRLENNWAWPRPESELGFSKQRWNEYRALIDKLGLESGLSRESDSEGTIIYLTAFAKGMVNRGSSKGYAYSEHDLLPVFASLDQNPVEPTKRQKHDVVYKKLQRHWYLSYDW